MSATYCRQGFGKSYNARTAEEEGRFTGSVWAKQIGKGVTAADIREACGRGEWHHVGKFANEARYYGDEEIEENMPAILAARDARLAAPAHRRVYKVTWTEWHGQGRSKRRTEHEFIGEATLKGDWITFVHQGRETRKKITGNWVRFEEVRS